jgi:hypothetical protein
MVTLLLLRITYILLPAHPEFANMQPTDETALLTRKVTHIDFEIKYTEFEITWVDKTIHFFGGQLRDSIEDNHAAVMKFATPAKLIQEARKVYPSSPDTPSLDTSISPPSPTRSSPTYGGNGLDSQNLHLIPPTMTYTSSAPPISTTVGKHYC